jgi:hypothetical protein
MVNKSLIPIEQREVEFYDDTITAVVLETGKIFVPIKPLCDYLGLNWSAQRKRIIRSEVLSQEQGMVVMTTPGGPQDVLALPLDKIPGWLFGISANRVKPELKDKIITYQRECFNVLWEAFQTGRLTSDPASYNSDLPAAHAYRIAIAVADLARGQLILESRVQDNVQRIEQLEQAITSPGATVTQDQASQISQAVKAVAMKLGEQTGRNEYGGVYGELYRKFGITSYKLLPVSRFQEAMDFLTQWHQSLVGDEPF